ncbi:FxLYD domain-containing protein [Bacillus marasmi]|uniref:FxLYD domain-containing protein n=1 Tax=Bacillus marasmi TaxID=1926279 RepID=UPI0011C9FA76|nr:FxLYD domain-containing protein [Bacillus marasmi]
MKKLIPFILVLSMFLFTGCSNEYAGTSEDKTNTSESTNKESKSQKEEAKLEMVDQTGGAWVDSIGTVWVHSAAVYKNTGSVPIDIGETQMNYKGQDGTVLGTSTMIFSIPSIVKPGETAFIGESTILDGQTDPANYKETTYNFGFDKTDEDPTILETSVVQGIKGDSFLPYKVTGMVKNITKDKQDDIRLAAGLFDESGKLLGVLTGSVDVGLNPGSEAGFELSYPEIPKEAVDKIAKVEVKAYGFRF